MAAQSAWTQPEGEAFYQFSFTQIGPYDELFQRRGPDFNTGREITESGLEAYGEFGLSDQLTLIGVLPIKYVDAGSIVPSATLQPTTIKSGSDLDLGNITLGLRRQITTGTYAVAGQLNVEFPTGSSDSRTGLSTGLDAFTFLPTVSVGRGFGKAYAQAFAGAAVRTNSYSNDLRLGAEAGYRVRADLLLAGTFELVDSRSNGRPKLDPGQLETGLYVDQQEYTSFGIKGQYDVSEEMGIHAAIRFASSGHNVAKTPFFTLGIYVRR